jgi:cold shock CspA family protein
MTGKIKFYKPLEFWGKISVDGQTKDLYFNFQNVQGELKTLFEFNKFKDEPVTFDIQESPKRVGEKEATNIKLDLTTRQVGHIYSYDQERGIGNIQDFNSKEKIFFHHSGIRKEFADKYERIEISEPVVFTNGCNDKGKCAIDILKIDARYHIEEFANFVNLRQNLLDLKNLAEQENWDYLKKPTRGAPVLFSYINQTCFRLIKQNKIVIGKSTKDKKEYAYFNTGLVTPQQDEIFAYFIKNPNYFKLTGWGVQSSEWNFIEFNTEQSVYRRYFIDVPEIATYFSEAEVADLIFDTRVPIIPDKEHLLKRKNRIESDRIRNLDDEAFVEEIKDAIELAKKRIKKKLQDCYSPFLRQQNSVLTSTLL